MKISSVARQLATFSIQLVNAISLHDKELFKKQLEQLVLKQLEQARQDRLDEAIDFLFIHDRHAYQAFLEVVEVLSESMVVQVKGMQYDCMLIVAPILAWTRFNIPSGQLPMRIHEKLAAFLEAHVFCRSARFVLAHELYTIDQLPACHTEVYALMKSLAQLNRRAKGESRLKHDSLSPFLADIRYLISAVMVPKGEPFYRWEDKPVNSNADVTQAQWQENAQLILSDFFHGCVLDLILPGGFFASCRLADQLIRPLALRAAINYLLHTFQIPAEKMRAVIAQFTDAGKERIEVEYRISFMHVESNAILYGVVWPLYEIEEMHYLPLTACQCEEAAVIRQTLALQEIREILEELGVACEKVHNEILPPDYCDECGAPLFADEKAELVHSQLPDNDNIRAQLH